MYIAAVWPLTRVVHAVVIAHLLLDVNKARALRELVKRDESQSTRGDGLVKFPGYSSACWEMFVCVGECVTVKLSDLYLIFQ